MSGQFNNCAHFAQQNKHQETKIKVMMHETQATLHETTSPQRLETCASTPTSAAAMPPNGSHPHARGCDMCVVPFCKGTNEQTPEQQQPYHSWVTRCMPSNAISVHATFPPHGGIFHTTTSGPANVVTVHGVPC